MTGPDPANVDRLTVSAGHGPARELVPLAGGANNRVYRVETERGPALLKAYLRHPDDPRDRLGTEFAFARFAWVADLRCIPRLLACDPAAGLGLFEFVDGQRPEQASDALVNQAVEFVCALNAARWRPAAASLPFASEACFSLAEHLGIVARRVNRLAEFAPVSDLDREAILFVRRDLLRAWELVREQTQCTARADRLSLERPLDLPARCVSPSDFGFHNSLVTPGGRACFLDFEYAGWDDPAKLVCDFFCQPAVPVPGRHFDPFARALAGCFLDPLFVTRARLLLPVYRIKWVCIILNEFLPRTTGRRLFSTGEELEARKLRQLAIAQTALGAVHERERSPA